MQSRAVEEGGQNWENFKLDIYQFYILDGNTLNATVAEFRDGDRLLASKSRWKQKLAEWGYAKNKKKRKRAAEDRATTFLSENARKTTGPIRNYQRIRAKVPAIVGKATPPSLQYHAPSVEREGNLSENACKQNLLSTSTDSATSKISRSFAYSSWSSGSQINNTLIPMTNIEEESPISILDRCLLGDEQTWSAYELSHQLRSHENRMAKLRGRISSITKIFGLPNETKRSPVFCCAANGFLLGPCTTSIVEEASETNVEEIALDELLSIAVRVAECQQKFGEFNERTLEQEFQLAKMAERNNLPGEAEYRCRRILGEYPYPDVQSFLGLLLAQSSRLEESSLCLFYALAGFIFQFHAFSYMENENASLFESIERLYEAVILQSELDLTSMTSCVHQMMNIIRDSQMEGDPQQLFPQLLIHGFSIANECAVLGKVDPAKEMYQTFLEYAPLHLNLMHHEMEMAKAYQKYGALLRIEKEWELSAEQLRLACECAARAGDHDRHLFTRLQDDYNNILPNLTTGPIGEESLAERIRKVLDRIALRIPAHLPANTEGAQVSPIAQFLQSDSPFHPLDPLTLFHVPGLESSSHAVESMRGDGEHTSTWSTAPSRNIAETVSDDQIPGISDSYLWPCKAV